MPENAAQTNVVFDTAALQQRCLNSVALAQRVVTAFLANGTEYVSEIEKCAAEKIWADAARAAHRLKGASQNVGAEILAQTAAEIEESARHHPESLAGPIAALWVEWETFQALACNFLSKDSVTNAPLGRD